MTEYQARGAPHVHLVLWCRKTFEELVNQMRPSLVVFMEKESGQSFTVTAATRIDSSSERRASSVCKHPQETSFPLPLVLIIDSIAKRP